MNRTCRILNASQYIFQKRFLHLTKTNKKLPFTRKDVRKYFIDDKVSELKKKETDFSYELSNQPKPGSSLNVYRRYYQKELQKPGRAALEEEYDQQVYNRYAILSLLIMLYVTFGFMEEVEYGIRWFKNLTKDGEVVKRHGPVLIDSSQLFLKAQFFLFSFIPVTKCANSYFVETDDSPIRRGDKVLLSQRPLVYTESVMPFLFRNKKCVLIVAAAEGDKVLLDGIDVTIPEGYVWVESLRPFNRLTLNFFDMFFLSLASNFWDSSLFSQTFSYEMRTSSDFGLCPIEYAKKVTSIHKFGDQQNYDLSDLQEKLKVNRLQSDDQKVENDDFLNRSDRRIQSAYYIPDNVRIFNDILNTSDLKYLENMSHTNQDDVFKVVHNRRSNDIPCNVTKSKTDHLPILDITNASIDEEEFRRDILFLLDNPEDSKVPSPS